MLVIVLIIGFPTWQTNSTTRDVLRTILKTSTMKSKRFKLVVAPSMMRSVNEKAGRRVSSVLTAKI
jgi:hypothetical protein